MLQRFTTLVILSLSLAACQSSQPEAIAPPAEPDPAVSLESPIEPAPEAPVVEEPPAPEPTPPTATEPETPAKPEPTFSEAIRAEYAIQDLDRFTDSAKVGDSPVAMATVAFAAEVLEEGRYSEEVESDLGQERAVVLFTQNNLADGSVKDMRYRAEYAKLTEQWQLVWVGFQSRCWEGRGHQDWSKEFCS